MKIIWLTFLLTLFSVSTSAQIPPIGIIDFYGLRSVSAEKARAALEIKEGDTPSRELKEAAQKRLAALAGVADARVDFVCCEAEKMILYAGIREKGSPALQFRAAPKGAILLPDEIVKTGQEFKAALEEAVQKGDVGEDESQGHALNNYPKLRAVQEKFIVLTAKNLQLLRTVLRNSANAEHRALAAQIIAYAPDKRDVVKDLVNGMSDADDTVRNNSLRALGVIANFAQTHPKKKIRVPLAPFVQLLNSIEWTDRNKSAFALVQLTAKRDAALLGDLRRNAWESLVEMARWKTPGHSYAPFVILGRVAGFPEDEIQKASEADRAKFIEKVLQKMPASAKKN